MIIISRKIPSFITPICWRYKVRNERCSSSIVRSERQSNPNLWSHRDRSFQLACSCSHLHAPRLDAPVRLWHLFECSRYYIWALPYAVKCFWSGPSVFTTCLKPPVHIRDLFVTTSIHNLFCDSLKISTTCLYLELLCI